MQLVPVCLACLGAFRVTVTGVSLASSDISTGAFRYAGGARSDPKEKKKNKIHVVNAPAAAAAGSGTPVGQDGPENGAQNEAGVEGMIPQIPLIPVPNTSAPGRKAQSIAHE